MITKKTKSFSMVPIKRTDVFQSIIERISQLIEEQLTVGDRLPSEREVSEHLGVSRTSVRQALKVLEAMGKVETRVGSGTYVTNTQTKEIRNELHFGDFEVTKAFIRQLVVARTGIERTIFEECSRIIDTAGIAELENILRDNENDLQSEADIEDGGLDLSFETKVGELTKNEILIKQQQQIHQLWVQAWRKYGYVPDKKELFHNEHLDILEALKSGNTQLVVSLIVQHVNKIIE